MMSALSQGLTHCLLGLTHCLLGLTHCLLHIYCPQGLTHCLLHDSTHLRLGQEGCPDFGTNLCDRLAGDLGNSRHGVDGLASGAPQCTAALTITPDDEGLPSSAISCGIVILLARRFIPPPRVVRCVALAVVCETRRHHRGVEPLRSPPRLRTLEGGQCH